MIVDNTPPVIRITSPLPKTLVRGTITVETYAFDECAIERVDFYIDDLFKASVNTSPYQYILDTTSLSDGNHIIKSVIFDKAGNEGFDSVDIIIDNTPPFTKIIHPRNNQKVHGHVMIKAIAYDQNGNSKSNNKRNSNHIKFLKFNDISKVEFCIDGELKHTEYKPKTFYKFLWDSKTVPNGAHFITEKAYDIAGNIGINSIKVFVINHHKK